MTGELAENTLLSFWALPPTQTSAKIVARTKILSYLILLMQRVGPGEVPTQF